MEGCKWLLPASFSSGKNGDLSWALISLDTYRFNITVVIRHLCWQAWAEHVWKYGNIDTRWNPFRSYWSMIDWTCQVSQCSGAVFIFHCLLSCMLPLWGKGELKDIILPVNQIDWCLLWEPNCTQSHSYSNHNGKLFYFWISFPFGGFVVWGFFWWRVGEVVRFNFFFPCLWSIFVVVVKC